MVVFRLFWEQFLGAMLVVGALYFFRTIGKLGISPGPQRLFQKSDKAKNKPS